MGSTELLGQKHLLMNAAMAPFECARAFYGIFHRWPEHVVYAVGDAPTVEVLEAQTQMLREHGVKVETSTQARIYCYVGPIRDEDVRVVER